MWRSGRVVECDGLEIRQVVHPSDTNQRLRLHSTTSFWGVLGGFGREMCNRMCNSKNFVQQLAGYQACPELFSSDPQQQFKKSAVLEIEPVDFLLALIEH